MLEIAVYLIMSFTLATPMLDDTNSHSIGRNNTALITIENREEPAMEVIHIDDDIHLSEAISMK